MVRQAGSNLVWSDLESSWSQDLQKRGCEEEERSHRQFFFNSCEIGWYCKIGSTFAHLIMKATPFVNTAGAFGDHPTHHANRHLQTQHHKDAVSSKAKLFLALGNLSKRRTDVWKLMQEAALSKEVSVAATNWFVIKSFF